MSYEYQIVVDKEQVSKAFFDAKKGIINSSLFTEVFTDKSSSCYKYTGTESNWDSDLEIFIENEELFLTIHAGNTKKVVSIIEIELRKNNISAYFDEL